MTLKYDELERLQRENERLSDALQEIADWCGAYPVTVFTKPDFVLMREVLTENEMPTALDAAHGTWARHLLDGVGGIANKALKD